MIVRVLAEQDVFEYEGDIINTSVEASGALSVSVMDAELDVVAWTVFGRNDWRRVELVKPMSKEMADIIKAIEANAEEEPRAPMLRRR